MDTRRLRMLADHLLTVPEDQFDMDYWGHNPKREAEFNCNTSACAAGWGTTHPILHQEGLRVRWTLYEDDGETRLRYTSATLEITIDGMRYRDDERGLKAFFGLSSTEVDQVFFGDQMTPIEKAKEIHTLCDEWDHQQFLKEKGAAAVSTPSPVS